MSIQKESYLCLSAMLKAREAKMLDNDRIQRMLEADSFEEAAKLLIDCGYEDMSQMKTKEIEAALAQHRSDVLYELNRLAPECEVIDLFKIKYDYHNAKTIIKAEAIGVDADYLMSDAGRIPVKKLTDAFIEEKVSYLPKTLAESMLEAKSILARTANPQLADFELDKAYFSELTAFVQALNYPFLTDYIKILIDSSNLKSTVRTLRMGKDSQFLDSVLIPGGTIDVKRYMEIEKDDLVEIFGYTVLEDAAQLGVAALDGGAMTPFELACDNAVNTYLSRVKRMSYGPEVLTAYLAALENEITAIRMILTGRLAGISSEVIKERMRDMYA